MFDPEERNRFAESSFYDPIKNQTYLNFLAILNFSKKVLNLQKLYMIF
ncbi:30S ribosomal protein S16 chloroplastic [Bienertia sinuspersici]